MTTYRRYDHVERLGHVETTDIEMGLVHVFPKLDGTNAVVWLGDDGVVRAGSRNREISVENDNQGFAAFVHANAEAFLRFFASNSGCILYGEWLVPHTLKTYRAEAWRKFYIFDVHDGSAYPGSYVPFEIYTEVLGECMLPDDIQVLQPLCTINNPSEGQLRAQAETNTYLVQDGAGVGEGIVVKNYSWRNKFGRQPWAKVVRNEFKEKNSRAFGAPVKEGAFQVEVAIADKFCTAEFVGKTRAKVVLAVANEVGIDLMEPNAQQRVESTCRSRVIPRLLGVVFYDFVNENVWDAIKTFKNPIVDFGLLQRHVTAKVKEYAQDLF
jgi:RNA ligase